MSDFPPWWGECPCTRMWRKANGLTFVQLEEMPDVVFDLGFTTAPFRDLLTFLRSSAA